MGRTAVRVLVIAGLGFLAGLGYARREQVRTLFAAPSEVPRPPDQGRSVNESDKPFTRGPGPPARPVRIGMNLEGVSDWSRQWAFVNAFKAAREWQEDGQKPFRYDARGSPLLKPGQRVATYLYRELDGHYPGGRHVVTWKGTG